MTFAFLVIDDVQKLIKLPNSPPATITFYIFVVGRENIPNIKAIKDAQKMHCTQSAENNTTVKEEPSISSLLCSCFNFRQNHNAFENREFKHIQNAQSRLIKHLGLSTH